MLCEVLDRGAELHLVDPFGHHGWALPAGWGATRRLAPSVAPHAAGSAQPGGPKDRRGEARRRIEDLAQHDGRRALVDAELTTRRRRSRSRAGRPRRGRSASCAAGRPRANEDRAQPHVVAQAVGRQPADGLGQRHRAPARSARPPRRGRARPRLRAAAPRRRPPGSSASTRRRVRRLGAVPRQLERQPRCSRSGPGWCRGEQVADAQRRTVDRQCASSRPPTSRGGGAGARDDVPLSSISRSRSSAHGSSRRYSSGAGSCARRRDAAVEHRVEGRDQADAEVANDWPGTDRAGGNSQAWMSRALQSLTSAARPRGGRARRRSPPAPGARHADDEAQLELDVEARARAEDRRRVARLVALPARRRIGVPLTTTVPARP